LTVKRHQEAEKMTHNNYSKNTVDYVKMCVRKFDTALTYLT